MQPSFFTPSHRSSLARSIPAPKFSNLAIYARLNLQYALYWWPRKLNDVQFAENGSCSEMGLWWHITPILRPSFRSSTPTQACRFGWTKLMPLVNSRTIYHCARKCAHTEHSRSPTGSSCYIFLSTKLIEREYPVRMNHALLCVNLTVAPFWGSNSTRLFARCRRTVKIRTLQLN